MVEKYHHVFEVEELFRQNLVQFSAKRPQNLFFTQLLTDYFGS